MFYRILLLGSLAVVVATPQAPVMYGAIPAKFRPEAVALQSKIEAMSTADFQTLQAVAAAGGVDAELELCFAYRQGIQVKPDHAAGFLWCQKAAALGNRLAEEDVGEQFMDGIGVTADRAQAIAWLEKAAGQGSGSAMQSLGTIYATTPPVDFGQAWRWYQKSVAAGYVPAEYDIGTMYLVGQGRRPDPKKGLQHLNLAADSGWPAAEFALGNLYLEGFAGVTPDPAKAVDEMELAANAGFAPAQGALANMYANGRGLPQDYAKAMHWYQQAAAQGDPFGEYGLGVRYLLGQAVAKDPAQALVWFRRAAVGGYGDAAFDAGLMLIGRLPGYSGQPDYSGAARYFAEAAAQGIFDAQCELGRLYNSGQGVLSDRTAALSWMLLSLQGSHGCVTAESELVKQMTPPEIAAARAKAQAFRPQPAPWRYDQGSH